MKGMKQQALWEQQTATQPKNRLGKMTEQHWNRSFTLSESKNSKQHSSILEELKTATELKVIQEQKQHLLYGAATELKKEQQQQHQRQTS